VAAAAYSLFSFHTPLHCMVDGVHCQSVYSDELQCQYFIKKLYTLYSALQEYRVLREPHVPSAFFTGFSLPRSLVKPLSIC